MKKFQPEKKSVRKKVIFLRGEGGDASVQKRQRETFSEKGEAKNQRREVKGLGTEGGGAITMRVSWRLAKVRYPNKVRKLRLIRRKFDKRKVRGEKKEFFYEETKLPKRKSPRI